MKRLDVIFNGWGERWQLGTLADNGSEILFEYAPEALRRDIELSPRHLPLRAEAWQKPLRPSPREETAPFSSNWSCWEDHRTVPAPRCW